MAQLEDSISKKVYLEKLTGTLLISKFKYNK